MDNLIKAIEAAKKKYGADPANWSYPIHNPHGEVVASKKDFVRPTPRFKIAKAFKRGGGRLS